MSDKYIKALGEALEARGLSLDEIGGVSKASSYQNMYKDENGTMAVKELWSFQYAPVTFHAPKWEPIRPAPMQVLPPLEAKVKPASKLKTCVIVPDVQIGYFRDINDKLVPVHDEGAISVAMEIIHDLQPSLIVCNGDNLDFPELSKYRLSPAYALTMQHALDRAALFASQLRRAAPKARIIWLAGNHEERLPNYILDNAKAAFGIKKANDVSAWPVMSIPFLCNFDKYKVEYVPAYPANDFWINSNLKVIHGNKSKSSGSTAHMYLASENVSVIFGHSHRAELAYKTRREANGPKTTMAASSGCLCRVDGAVPSTNGGTDLDGRPVKLSENWNQGIGVVQYETTGKERFTWQHIPILEGWALHDEKEYKAPV